MPTARRLLSMPLNQLILPSQDILDGLVPFMYSELTIPSRVHEVVIDNLLGELKTVVRVYNKRRIVTRRIIALLTPLAGRKPRRTHCNVHGHRFFKVLLVNGSTDHRTNNIGWWQLLCFNANNKVIPHKFPLTQPVLPSAIIANPKLFALLVVREMLRPRSKQPSRISLLSLGFSPDGNSDDDSGTGSNPSSFSFPTMRPLPDPLPTSLHSSPDTKLLPPIELKPHSNCISTPLKTKRGIIPGVCPDASPISPCGSDFTMMDVDDELDDILLPLDWNPFKRSPATATTTPISFSSENGGTANSGEELLAKWPSPRKPSSSSPASHLAKMIEHLTLIRGGKENIPPADVPIHLRYAGATPYHQHVKLPSSHTQASMDRARKTRRSKRLLEHAPMTGQRIPTKVQRKRGVDPRSPFVDLTEDLPTRSNTLHSQRIDDTVFEKKNEVIDLTLDSDGEDTAVEQVFTPKVVEAHFIPNHGSKPRTVNLEARPSGNIVLRDHLDLLVALDIDLKYSFEYIIKDRRHPIQQWTAGSWHKGIYVGLMGEGGYIIFKEM